MQFANPKELPKKKETPPALIVTKLIIFEHMLQENLKRIKIIYRNPQSESSIARNILPFFEP